MVEQSDLGLTRGDWPFGALLPQHYNVILSDPPWRFHNYSAWGEKKNPIIHYPCMELPDLMKMPVADLAARDCVMFMWATSPLLDKAFDLLKAWEFEYKATASWAKQSRSGNSWAFGGGYIWRSAAEFLLLGTRGKPQRKSRSIRNLIVAPVREHSRKPDQTFSDIEALYDGPYAELFAREARPGWSAWGNQTDKFSAAIKPAEEQEQDGDQ